MSVAILNWARGRAKVWPHYTVDANNPRRWTVFIGPRIPHQHPLYSKVKRAWDGAEGRERHKMETRARRARLKALKAAL